MTGARTLWDAAVEPYALALAAVAGTCQGAARRHLGLDMPELVVTVRRVPPGQERVATDYDRTVIVEAAGAAQFRPSTVWRWIYGVAHEAAHVAVARMLGPGRVPPVVWDEALAHFVATRVFLPEVWDEHGASLWPDPYPDYVAAEGALPAGSAGHFGGYVASLRALDAHLTSLAGQVGISRVVAAVGEVTPTDLRADRFGPALERRCR